MENKKIVVALGRNAFGNILPEQHLAVKKAAAAIADLVEQKYQVIITHSNGPQVGMVHTAMTEFSRLDNDYTVAPMSICSAMSQGYIGYDLQNAIRSELLNRGIFRPVSTIITQVKVSPYDEAFNNPTKVIGRAMSPEEAAAEEKKGNYVVSEDNGETYRRIVASPEPLEIYEIDAIKALVDAGQIVIACGGGGIPVLEQGTTLKGASAIIEKDKASEKLAEDLDAGTLLFLSKCDHIVINEGKAEEKVLGLVAVDEAEGYVSEGHFNAITSLPKMEAAIKFAKSAPYRRSIITHLDNAKSGVLEKSGTIIK